MIQKTWMRVMAAFSSLFDEQARQVVEYLKEEAEKVVAGQVTAAQLDYSNLIHRLVVSIDMAPVVLPDGCVR